MHQLFETARQKVAKADHGDEEWETAQDAVHGLRRLAQRMFVPETHQVLTHLERAVTAAEEQDASGVMQHLRLAESELP